MNKFYPFFTIQLSLLILKIFNKIVFMYNAYWKRVKSISSYIA